MWFLFLFFFSFFFFKGTPGTYLPSHAVYGPEGTKSTVGSISLGLPRQQDPNKPSKMKDVNITHYKTTVDMEQCRADASQIKSNMARVGLKAVFRKTSFHNYFYYALSPCVISLYHNIVLKHTFAA